jgi:cytochrome c oxidase cbb3-type subunit 3
MMESFLSFIPGAKKLRLLTIGLLLLATPALAQKPHQVNALDNPLAQVLVIIMVLLAVAIGVLAGVVNGAATVYRQKMQAEKEEQKRSGAAVIPLILLPLFMLLSLSGFSQDAAAAPAVDSSINGLDASAFYAMIGVIFLEILVMIVLIFQIKGLLGLERKRKAPVAALAGVPKISWWDRINRSIAIEKEKDIDLNHEYDGIRELDNSIPPWWMFGFIFFIVFGVGYMWRYHVAKSAPLQIEELQIAMEKAEVEKDAYLKLSASKVDENSIVLLDADGIAIGKELFSRNCMNCHGAEAQGASVGPNLTDDYWLHGGDIKDVFKSIKYGWPDKGMRSWKEDFSPVQMAQLASFVKSVKGSKPPDSKEPQGELYTESAGDSTSAKAPAP